MKRIFTKPGEKSGSIKVGTESKDPRNRRQRGTIMMLTALMITVMIGFLALSIDLGFAFSARGQFQNGIDAAALAGVAATRLTIESTYPGPQQRAVAEKLAADYAKLNQVRRYADPGKNDPSPNANDIVLTNGNIQVQASGDELPRVKVDSSIPVPTLFAGMFGLNGFNISAAATATVLPVDGGTGTIGLAKSQQGGGCWSPVMLADTFFDSSNNVHWAGDPARGLDEWPTQFGDYYRSRFAAGARNTPPYLDAYGGGVGDYVTGVRDTRTTTDIDLNKTVMGRYIEIKPKYYRIANLAALPAISANGVSTSGYSVTDAARYGYCGQIRVGMDMTVFSKDDTSVYDQARLGLQSLKANTYDSDFIDMSLINNYRYVKSSSYPSPNTHAMIVPVMLFSPVDLARNPDLTQLRVTNIGMFFMQEVRDDGTLYGFFVRELVAGGTPIEPANMAIDSDLSFKRIWLPMSIQLMR
ncbi:MAG TPA: pilus assembly protein TadG-related protein [Blastocatellia bacterium]|nr:pilus assembly protein TadG-related protein [Blastocatellia bacterium]